MHRFFVSPELIEGNEVFFPSDLAHQLARVLRLRAGDRVVVLDNSGLEREVELHSFAKRAVQGTVRDVRPNQNEPALHLTLYMALLKGKKLEWVLQKGTELGTARFVPILTSRSVIGSLRKLGDAKLDRWESIVREAAEQSGRGYLPEVVEPMLYERALGEARSSQALSLIAWEQEARPLRRVLANPQQDEAPRVNLFVGPEGGFDESEVREAETYGVLPVSLGPRILRAETAMVAMVAALFYEFGEWEL